MTPLRLRHLVLVAVAGLGIQSLIPRALAYWQLHGVATELANYALCMAGPTGPTLLTERPAEFWQLVRRRLVASPPLTRPFAACAPLLDAFDDDDARQRSHQAKAEEFREYAPFRAKLIPNWSVATLAVTTARLEALAEAASPFLRTRYRELVRPSRNARGAPHPVELPQPADGRGLPKGSLGPALVGASDGGYLVVAGKGARFNAYRSRDGGTTWSLTPDDHPLRARAGECSGGQTSAGFKLGVYGAQLRLESWLNGELQTSFPLTSSENHLSGFACDKTAALAVIREEGQLRPRFLLCPHLGSCRDLPLPSELRDEPRPEASFSVARVRGVTVISASHEGVVRVVSSRDDGESWTPSVVAYDRGDRPSQSRSEVTPTQLLGLDGRVLLYAGADRADVNYPVLASDDFGASWQGR